jgi:hypothetical protein
MNRWQTEAMDGWMNGWMGELLFFGELLLHLATSSLRHLFSLLLLLWAATYLGYFCLPASSFAASATQFFSSRSCSIHAFPNCYSPLLLPDTNCSCLLLTQWQDCPWTFIRNSEVFELIKLPSVKSHWSICGSHGSNIATNTPTLQPSYFVLPFRFDSTCQCTLQRVRSCISWYPGSLRFVHHKKYQVLLNLHCSPWCWPILWLVANK